MQEPKWRVFLSLKAVVDSGGEAPRHGWRRKFRPISLCVSSRILSLSERPSRSSSLGRVGSDGLGQMVDGGQFWGQGRPFHDRVRVQLDQIRWRDKARVDRTTVGDGGCERVDPGKEERGR